MTYPEFYQPERVGQLYAPQVEVATQAGHALGLRPADEDRERILLILVDAQVDFIHPDGALSVPGAVNDTRRTIEWIFRNVERITTIAASLDSHVPLQIFFPTWWVNAEGNHPTPYTAITSDDVGAGRWRPVYEQAWSGEYVRHLEEQAKKTLMIWPYHTLIGTPGHSLTPALYEAVVYHAAARRTQPVFLPKGSLPKTEHYSILEPEVKVPEQSQGTLNTDFLDLIRTYDRVYIAGQAKSHCVLETVTSMMNAFEGEPATVQRLRVLTDAMSSVAHPTIDFDALANATLEQYQQRGLRLADTHQPLG